MAIDRIAMNDYPYQALCTIISARNEAASQKSLEATYLVFEITKANVNYLADPCVRSFFVLINYSLLIAFDVNSIILP
ncbi:hypothetical protein ENKO_41540 [Enterobacter kobei]|uniref:Uncharacterized protein n=1 Tax=Enterobacter kobei TaxID=208224 RepID=A0AA86IUW3_9ENTR|nr:hypothetical protein ENKO_41540 [Enterobacter kobei]